MEHWNIRAICIANFRSQPQLSTFSRNKAEQQFNFVFHFSNKVDLKCIYCLICCCLWIIPELKMISGNNRSEPDSCPGLSMQNLNLFLQDFDHYLIINGFCKCLRMSSWEHDICPPNTIARVLIIKAIGRRNVSTSHLQRSDAENLIRIRISRKTFYYRKFHLYHYEYS